MSWFGRSATTPIRFSNILDPAPVPPVFSPLDISGLALWLDANDSLTIEVNSDTSGNNVNRVMKWFDKAKPNTNNYFHHHGSPSTSGLYNVHRMNELNTVFFENSASMSHSQGGISFPFNDRTMFITMKPITDISGEAPGNQVIFPFFGDGLNAQANIMYYDSNTWIFSQCQQGVTCGVEFDISYNPVKNPMILMWAQTDQVDLSGNAGTLDSAYKSLITSDVASYEQSTTQYYLGFDQVPTSFDLAEIILYGRLLTTFEQEIVNDYLVDKWCRDYRGIKPLSSYIVP